MSQGTRTLHLTAGAVVLAIAFGCLPVGRLDEFAVGGGLVGVARTGACLGSGYVARVAFADDYGTCMGWGLRLVYREVDFDARTIRRVTGEFFLPYGPFDLHLGIGTHWDESGGWGAGPSVGAGAFLECGRHVLLGVMGSAYAWLGSLDHTFDAGIEVCGSIDLTIVF